MNMVRYLSAVFAAAIFLIVSSFALTGCGKVWANLNMRAAYNLLPVFKSITPASPAPNNEPTVTGTSYPGSTVTFYSNASCSDVLTSGSVDSSGNFSIPVIVPAGATTTIYANATGPTGTVSSCTAIPLSYTENSTCSGSFEPMISQHGGGIETTGDAVIHNSCATYVAGSNSISSTGVGFLAGANEEGSGGSPSTSMFVSKYDYKGYLLWTSEYAETNADVSIAGMVQDESGNLYVAGTVSCIIGQTCSFGGTVNGTSGLNANGNSNVFVIKFNSSGALQWVTQLGGGTIGGSGPSIMAKAVTIDSSGNVYVAGGAYNLVGTEIGSHGQIDSFVTKVSSTGAIAWTSQMGNGGTSDYIGYGVAIDSLGHVDVSGSAQGALLANQLSTTSHGFNDLFVNQLTSTGGNSWSYQIGNGGDMWGTSLATDSSNNIYISGYTDGLLTPSPISATLYGTHGNRDTFLMKFSSTGTYTWTAQYGTEHAGMTLGLLGGDDLALDGSNNFYLVGSANGYLGGGCYDNCGGTSDTFVQKMSSTGAQDWIAQIGLTGDGSGNSVGNVAITTDSSGNSYISSLTNSLMSYLFGSHKVDNLFATVDSTGAFDTNTSTAPTATHPYWPLQQGAGSTFSVVGNAITQDPSGNIWVTGDTTGSVVTSPGQQFGTAGPENVYLSKFDANGNLKCTDELGASGANTYGYGIINDTVSGFDIVGNTTGAIGTQIGTHGSQDALIANFPGCGGTPTAIQYGAASATLTGAGIAQYSGNLFVTGRTNVYLGGTQSGIHGADDMYIAKFTSGALSWVSQLGTSSSTDTTEGTGLVSDGSGNFYVTGYTTGSLGGTQYGTHGTDDLFVAKYNSSGALQWAVQLGASTKITEGTGITIDKSGNIDAVGYTTGSVGTQDGYHGSQDLVVASFTSTGAENWVHQLGTEVPCIGGEACNGFLSGSTTGTAIVADSSGDLYVSGYATGMATNDTQYGSHGSYDAIVAAYNTGGTYQWMSNYGLTAATTQGSAITLSTVSPRKVLMTGIANGFLGGTQFGTHGSDDFFVLGADASGLMP